MKAPTSTPLSGSLASMTWTHVPGTIRAPFRRFAINRHWTSPMLSRPFATTCYSAPYPGGGDLQVIVDFKAVVELTPDMLDQLRRPFQGLAEMGQWGGMAGEK